MKRSLLFCCGALLLLSACSSDKGPIKMCPQVAVVRELERVEDHGRDSAVSETLVASALMKGIEGKCDFQESGVDINFTLKMAAEKGPRLGGSRISFPFFVSVINPAGKIVSKEVMTADFKFPSDKNLIEKEEPLRVFIPMEKNELCSAYRVLIGFQLTEAQLEVRRDEEKK